jgi:hypothetical protein
MVQDWSLASRKFGKKRLVEQSAVLALIEGAAQGGTN